MIFLGGISLANGEDPNGRERCRPPDPTHDQIISFFFLCIDITIKANKNNMLEMENLL
jgi:hypothetical protein